MQLKIGCDPEFFVHDGKQFVSAHDLVPGDKAKPFPLKHGAVQADGTAIEFNIKPATSSAEFVSSIHGVLAEIRTMVPKDLGFEYKPSVVYPKGYFDKLPQYSKELGCNPDYNAYTGKQNPPPNGDPNNTMRTGAGHIHLGWTDGVDPLDKSHMWDCCHIVEKLDLYFQSFEKLWDKDDQRRKMYGAKGAFRPKPYGCEYRVLSNAWLKYPKLWPWIFDSVQYVFDFELKNKYRSYGFFDASDPDRNVRYANENAAYYFDKNLPVFKSEYLS